MEQQLPHNIGLDLVRVTELAAITAGRWMGLGNLEEADQLATAAMADALNSINFDCKIVIGEEGKYGSDSPLASGCTFGTRNGPTVDIVVDPIEGRNLLAQGRSGALAVAAITPRDAMWSPKPAVYMDKIVVNRQVAGALVDECIDAPAAWTLALVARMKKKPVRDLTVFVLERPRHQSLIDEIRSAGARVMLRKDGDIAGAILAASPEGLVDLMIGIGGTSEGVIAACAVKSLRGGMLVRLAPQDSQESVEVKQAGLNLERVFSCDEMVASRQIFFAATGITDGPLLRGVRYHGDIAETQSIVLRGETGTRRKITAEHRIK